LPLGGRESHWDCDQVIQIIHSAVKKMAVDIAMQPPSRRLARSDRMTNYKMTKDGGTKNRIILELCLSRSFRLADACQVFAPVAVCLLVFPILTLPGCAGPSITRFDVRPQVLCGNQSAVATWDVSGEPAINFSVEPVPLASGRCSAAGRETFALDLMVQKHGKEAGKQVEVVRIADGSAEPGSLTGALKQSAERVTSRCCERGDPKQSFEARCAAFRR
jgi:hypothetical protein